jgi:hypothetical protein
MQDQVRRTFHVPTQESYTLNVSEDGNRILISFGPDSCSMSKEQFKLLADLLYQINWAPDVQIDLPI